MQLKKKIALSFILSSSLIAVLVAFEFVNYIEIRKEIRYLELTDTIRTKSLQLRRHEKNFFLYSPQKGDEESRALHGYLTELKTIVSENLSSDRTGKLREMDRSVDEYTARFDRIEHAVKDLSLKLEEVKGNNLRHKEIFSLVELTFLERPLKGADFLESTFSLPPGHELIRGLQSLDRDIAALRKNGEDLIDVSKELDQRAREKADGLVYRSQVAILVFFPLFLVVGVGTLFYMVSSVTGRLGVLAGVIEKTGKGDYTTLPVGGYHDEVGVLIEKFNAMEEALAERERELGKKNEELHLSRKLAAIGTLASGVAHELNNPLNNIYISAQVLAREAGEGCPPAVGEVVTDIVGQTARVKRIVGDLLEFARGRDPQPRTVDVTEVVRNVHRLVGTTTTYNTGKINFRLKSPGPVLVYADPDQIERVFINLFTNAVDAMAGVGELSVEVAPVDGQVRITVSDTGAGIGKADLEKVFEPFFTTKDRGTGLGLAIVFNIIKKNGGDIAVKSETGKGTVFTVTLPKGDA
jgi:two-component system NtrC family sensor kinase